MTRLFCLSLVTAILCGAWILLSNVLGLLSWAGFAGCTAFFAAGTGGARALKSALVTVSSGIVWGMVIVLICARSPLPHTDAWMTALVTFVLCIQSKCKPFSLIPGAFIGCFCVFAANGAWLPLAPSLILGACLGWLCESSGGWLYTLWRKRKTIDKYDRRC